MRISSRLKSPITFGETRRKTSSGAHLLLSSFDPDAPRRIKAPLGPPRQLTRYSVIETPSQTTISLDAFCALRRFVEPERPVNVAQQGALWRSLYTKRSRSNEMLEACVQTQEGAQALLRADVVAERDVIRQLMLPHKASFTASFVHGVLFLDAAEKQRFDSGAHDRKMGFLRACTEMYADKHAPPPGRATRTLHAVVGRQLGGLNLLMSGSVDCVKYKYTGQPSAYMHLVTRPLLPDGTYRIRPKVWKAWYLKAHLMGVRSLYLGFVDQAGVLRHTRQLATSSLPFAAGGGGQGDGGRWNPEDNIHWAYRVLCALRDYCQEAADVCEVRTPSLVHRGLWQVEVVPSKTAAIGGGGGGVGEGEGEGEGGGGEEAAGGQMMELRVLVRPLEERLPRSAPVIRNFEKALEMAEGFEGY